MSTVGEILSRENINRAQSVLDHFGYVVMAWLPGPKALPRVGDVLPGPVNGVPGPFVVVGEATREDSLAQARHLGVYAPGIDEIPVVGYLKVRAE